MSIIDGEHYGHSIVYRETLMGTLKPGLGHSILKDHSVFRLSYEYASLSVELCYVRDGDKVWGFLCLLSQSFINIRLTFPYSSVPYSTVRFEAEAVGRRVIISELLSRVGMRKRNDSQAQWGWRG